MRFDQILSRNEVNKMQLALFFLPSWMNNGISLTEWFVSSLLSLTSRNLGSNRPACGTYMCGH